MPVGLCYRREGVDACWPVLQDGGVDACWPVL